MPQIKIAPDTYLETYVRPLAAVFGDAGIVAYNVFKATLGVGVDLTKEISFNIPNPFPDLGDGGGGGAGPPNLLPPIPVLQPIDPQLAVTQIAQAVREAEKILNSENLAIGGATAEINVVVSVGGVAGANATLKINLGPTPRG